MARTKEEIAKYQAEYYAANTEKVKERVRLYQSANYEKIKAYKKAYRDSHKGEQKAWKTRNYERVKTSQKEWFAALPYQKAKWYHYRSSAKQRGIEWELTFDQFTDVILNTCHFCGAVGGSVDRKDSSKSYSPENVLPACSPCNKMKMDFDYDFFLSKCKEITKKHG